MTYRIVVEPTAEREIRSAVRWKTENASPAVAARWYNGLVKKIDTLRHHPTRCPLAAENDKFPEEIRELLYGRSGKRIHKHRILFTVREDTVHILYVRHTARDELEPLTPAMPKPFQAFDSWNQRRTATGKNLVRVGGSQSPQLPWKLAR